MPSPPRRIEPTTQGVCTRSAWRTLARAGSALALAWLTLQLPAAVHALDKQGSAHGGSVAGADSGFALSGTMLAGAAIYNPSYAARPQNTGHALLRVAPHFDVDLIGSRLSVPIDINLFSDRDRPGAHKLVPSELDLITGLTTTWPVGPTALELGARVEGDFSVDRAGRSQRYADVRARWLYAVSAVLPGISDTLAGGDITGAATLGCFAFNPTYAARPDNTGLALLRYALHVTVRYTPHYFVGLDATFFTDRRASGVGPSELDATFELGAMLFDGLELHLSYERDMPVDRGELVQHFMVLHLSWDFRLVEHTAAPAAANAMGFAPGRI